MKEQLRLLTELQQFDAKIQELQHSMRALPEKLAPAKQDLARLDSLLQGEKDELAKTEAWQREQESVLAQESEAIKSAKAKLQASGNTREYTAANRELEAKRKSMSDREEEVLKVITALEISRKNIADHETDVQTLRDHVTREDSTIAADVDQLRTQVDASQNDREVIISKLNANTLKRYEHVRRRRGIAVVPVVDSSCSGCHMRIPPQLLNILARRNSLESCPSCQRLLYPEDMLDDAPAEG